MVHVLQQLWRRKSNALFLNVGFGFDRDFRQDQHCANGIFAYGSLTRKHDSVGAIKNGVGDVGDFRACRRGVVNHRLQHLRGDDHGFAGFLAGAHDLLLHERDGREIQFHAQVAAGDEDGIGSVDDGGEIFDGLGHFDFGDDARLGAALIQVGAQLADFGRGADE